MSDEELEKNVPKWLLVVPFWMEWVTYKGEVCVTLRKEFKGSSPYYGHSLLHD